MVYVILYFNTEILRTKKVNKFYINILIFKAKMREVVDKHFYDNWVVPFYLGYYIDLTTEWAPFKAAKIALGNTLDLEYIEDLAKFN